MVFLLTSNYEQTLVLTFLVVKTSMKLLSQHCVPDGYMISGHLIMRYSNL